MRSSLYTVFLWLTALLALGSIESAICVSALGDEPSPKPEAASAERAAAQRAEATEKTPPADPLAKTVETFRVAGPLDKALRRLSQSAGMPIRVDWRALQTIGVGPKTDVHLRTDRLSYRRALELMLAQVAPDGAPLGWTIVDGEILVSTQSAIAARTSKATAVASTRRTKSAASGDTARPTDRTPSVYNFDATPLTDVTDFLAHTKRLNVHVNWRALGAVGITEATPITLKLHGVSLGRLLTVITDDLSAGKGPLDSVYWLVNEGVVQITTGHALNQTLSRRMVDIADMLVIVPNFISPRVDLSISQGQPGEAQGLFEEGSDTEDDPAAQRQATREAVIEMIKDTIPDELWEDGGGKGSIKIVGTRLIISQTKLGFLLMDRARRR
ncbi:MAG: hypothetical protein ACYS8X_06465 [Planctomycetota bacterium]|jgi:hypothetical protein